MAAVHHPGKICIICICLSCHMLVFAFLFKLQGITHEEMVQESKRHWQRLEQNAQRQKVTRFFFSSVQCQILNLMFKGPPATSEFI